jgi:hypothetical protein
MRFLPGLVLALTVGATGSLYTSSAHATGVYVGVGIPAPVIAAPAAAVAPYYYGPRVWLAPGYYGPHYWGYGRVAYGYRHGYWGSYGYRRR